MTRLARPSASTLTGVTALPSLASRSWAGRSLLAWSVPSVPASAAVPLPPAPAGLAPASLPVPLPALPPAGVAGSAPGLLLSSSRPLAGRPSISGPNGDGVDAASGTRNGR